MRIAPSIFVGFITLVVIFASPVSGAGSSPNSHANANAQATEEAPAAAGCHAYQKGPDGNWIETACHEGIETAPLPGRVKSTSHHHADRNVAH